jgi:hypothetical protein
MSNYTDHNLGKKSSKFQCNTCRKSFHITFDLRGYHRVNINISGEIFHTYTEAETSNIIIISLSVGGIGFIINSELEVKTGDIYTIKFQLDDKYSSVICEDITVKRIDGRFVGAEFYQSDSYNHDLDFYIVAAL